MSLSLVSLCVVAGASNCAYYSQEDGERLNNEVYALQTQITAMQQAVNALQSSEKRQVTQLSSMTKEIAELSKAARRNDADLGVQLEQMLQETARMRGRVETFSERVSELEAANSKVQEELDLRFKNLQEQAKIDAANSAAEKAKAIEEARKREQLLSAPSAMFEEVERSLRSNNPKAARELLREFMIRAAAGKIGRTKRERSDYKARAQYLIGESYRVEGQYQQGAAALNKVRKLYPKSKWVPYSLYKLGICFEKLNLPEDAKLFYKTVAKSYRRSKVAKDAKKRLKALK